MANWSTQAGGLIDGTVAPGKQLMAIAAPTLNPEFTANQAGLWTFRGAGPLALSALEPTNTRAAFKPG